MSAESRREFTDKILKGYEENYDITLCEDSYEGLIARAEYHVSESGYTLIRKAETWTAESDEYVYFFSMERLSEAFAEESIRKAYDIGIRKADVKNRKNHMCTRVVLVFICDEIDESAAKVIKSCKLRKDFMFAFKGWMEIHTVAKVLGGNEGEVLSNRYGKDTAKFIRYIS